MWYNQAMGKYWNGPHTKHRLMYHVVWIPKYRRRVLIGKIASRLKGILFEGCELNGWRIHKLSIQENHVHILIQVKPSDSVSEVVMRLKSASSKKLREEFSELEEFIWGNGFWADGYFAETVGKVEESVVRDYIEKQ